MLSNNPAMSPSRKCSGCGRIHPGPFFDDNCPVLKKNQNKSGSSQNIMRFCSDLVTVLGSMKSEEAIEKISQIKKLLNM